MSKHVMISTQWFHLAVPIGNATTWESVYILDPQWSHDSHMGDCLFNWFSLIGTWQQGSHMTRACSTWREGVWDMTSSLWPAPWGAYRSQPHLHSLWQVMWPTLAAWKPALALLYPKYYFFTVFCQWVNVIALASLCPADALFSDCITPLSYQLKYSHMNRSRETILGYNRAREGFNT